MSNKRYSHVVVIETEDDGPIVVGFNNPFEAKAFVEAINMIGEDVWPDSFHNYARMQTRPIRPNKAMRQVIADAVVAKKYDRGETE